jgi:hypothetical protein
MDVGRTNNGWPRCVDTRSSKSYGMYASRIGRRPSPSATPLSTLLSVSLAFGKLAATKPSGLSQPSILPNSGVGGYSILVTTFGNTSLRANSDARAQ